MERVKGNATAVANNFCNEKDRRIGCSDYNDLKISGRHKRQMIRRLTLQTCKKLIRKLKSVNLTMSLALLLVLGNSLAEKLPAETFV